MPWSGLRSRFKTFLATGVRNRIDFHVTGYRKAHEERGKGWITIDGKTLITFCDFIHENAWRAESAANDKGHWNVEAQSAIQARIILPDGSLGAAMEFVMNHPVRDSLSSANPLIVALASLDRRTGKRRLAQIDTTGLPDWAKTLIQLRQPDHTRD